MMQVEIFLSPRASALFDLGISDETKIPQNSSRVWPDATAQGENTSDKEQRAKTIGLQCRWTLITSTITSFVDMLQPDFLAAMVR